MSANCYITRSLTNIYDQDRLKNIILPTPVKEDIAENSSYNSLGWVVVEAPKAVSMSSPEPQRKTMT